MKRLLGILLGCVTFANAQNDNNLKTENMVPPIAKKEAKNWKSTAMYESIIISG